MDKWLWAARFFKTRALAARSCELGRIRSHGVQAKPAREVPSLTPGDRVQHDTFGLGIVVAVEGVAEKAVASIDFGSDGVKRLLLRYAPVDKL